MSEMVERVARALHAHQVETGQCEPDIRWQSFEGEARAAIEAMRNPTNNVWLAPVLAKPHVCVNGVLPTGEEAEAMWNCMIDAALKGEG